MKFYKKYQEYMLGKAQKLPGIGCKQLKNILKNCPVVVQSQKHLRHDDGDPELIQPGLHHCSVCDGSFFPSLVNDMSTVVSYFNDRARKLLKHHQSAGFRKYFSWFQGKLRGTDISLIEEAKDLVIYALTNAIAIQRLLEKYDKVADVHNCCKQGPAFKSQAQRTQIEILQSPWLRELMAFNINLRETNLNSSSGPECSESNYLRFNDGQPSLFCDLFDAMKLDIDLTCPVCLETVFDPVSLTCGHILCQMCACSAASVTIVDGLKSAEPKQKCPLCRQAGVYKDAVQLTELSILLSRSCRDYWEKRLKMERMERVRQAKEYWESQCRAFTGI